MFSEAVRWLLQIQSDCVTLSQAVSDMNRASLSPQEIP